MADPVVTAEMLIRRPPGEVFAAFANPQTIRKFWFGTPADRWRRARACSGISWFQAPPRTWS